MTFFAALHGGSASGFWAGMSNSRRKRARRTLPANNANAEPLVGRRREEEYDPATGQMLVTDENGNMKLFYKDEDGNLRVKEKDQDGNILDRNPNPSEYFNEVRLYQGYSQGATIINVSDTKIERDVTINQIDGRDYKTIKSDLLLNMPTNIKDSTINRFNNEISGNLVDVLKKSEDTSKTNIQKEKEKIHKDKEAIESWSNGGIIKKEKEIIARGVEEKLNTEQYKKLIEKQNNIDTLKAGLLDISKGKSLLEQNALKDRFIDFGTEQIATYSKLLSKEVTSGRLTKEVFNKLVNDKVIELDKNRKEALKNISASTYLKTFQGLNEKMFPGGKDEKASFLTPTEKKSTSNRYHLGELNYELLSTKEKNKMDAKLEKAGLKPSAEVLKTNPEIKNAYQKLIVNYVLKEREILSKAQESALNQKQIDAFKNSAIKEVSTQVTSLKAREKAAFEVKISYKDPATGKIVSKLVDSRDPSLNAEQSKLAKKALAEKEETRILKERDKVEKEWKANNDRILEQKLIDAASEARIKELTSYSQQEWVDAMAEQPDPDKRAKMLEERKLKEHAAEIREIQSISRYKIVDSYVESADTIFKQTKDLKFLLSLETGESIKSETLSEADAAYLRSKWCVAVSTWNMLKSNFGDDIPDFIPFVKEMHSKGWIKNSNMELLRVDNIMNHYAKEHGKGFDRVSLQGLDTRADRYNKLANELIEKKPESITLRVKEEVDESGNTRGHTISLHRLPNGTYKVVDTSQPSINGSIFDPANVEESPLGSDDDAINPYYNKLPKAYDNVK